MDINVTGIVKKLYEKAIEKKLLIKQDSAFKDSIQFSRILNGFSLYINDKITRYDVNHYAVLKTNTEYKDLLIFKNFKVYLEEKVLTDKKHIYKIESERYKRTTNYRQKELIELAKNKEEKDRTLFEIELLSWQLT